MRRRQKYDDILTPREWEVLDLLRQGLTNEQIAERLGISFATAKYHVGEILSKLGVSSQQEAVQALEERRAIPAALPWLPLPALRSVMGGRRVWRVAAGSIVLAAGSAVLTFLVFGWLPGSSPGDGAKTSASSAVGLDAAPEGLRALEQARLNTPYKHTILLSKGMPANVGTEADVIASLPRVGTFAELRAALSPDVRLIVVDQSALGELVGTDFLYDQWEGGRAIMGLNVSNTELRELSDFVKFVNERRTDGGEARPQEIRTPSVPGEGFYSVLVYNERQAGVVFVGGHQKYFFEGQFQADLGNLDQGTFVDVPAAALRIADLPEERISVNRGMGCTYDDAKTAAAAKRELVARRRATTGDDGRPPAPRRRRQTGKPAWLS